MDIIFLFKIAGIGLIVAILQQMLSKSGRDEFATLTVITGIIVIIAMLIPQIIMIFDDIGSIFDL
ncbi:MAG: stage III sporulation protein AC [Clostridia bacterium]|nr:stage III sporulation protein AC [Clostridia bacterium]